MPKYGTSFYNNKNVILIKLKFLVIHILKNIVVVEEEKILLIDIH